MTRLKARLEGAHHCERFLLLLASWTYLFISLLNHRVLSYNSMSSATIIFNFWTVTLILFLAIKRVFWAVDWPALLWWAARLTKLVLLMPGFLVYVLLLIRLLQSKLKGFLTKTEMLILIFHPRLVLIVGISRSAILTYSHNWKGYLLFHSPLRLLTTLSDHWLLLSNHLLVLQVICTSWDCLLSTQ